jgi:hypothetical protein
VVTCEEGVENPLPLVDEEVEGTEEFELEDV